MGFLMPFDVGIKAPPGVVRDALRLEPLLYPVDHQNNIIITTEGFVLRVDGKIIYVHKCGQPPGYAVLYGSASELAEKLLAWMEGRIRVYLHGLDYHDNFDDWLRQAYRLVRRLRRLARNRENVVLVAKRW